MGPRTLRRSFDLPFGCGPKTSGHRLLISLRLMSQELMEPLCVFATRPFAGSSSASSEATCRALCHRRFGLRLLAFIYEPKVASPTERATLALPVTTAVELVDLSQVYSVNRF